MTEAEMIHVALDKRDAHIAELEAALRTIVEAWHLMPPAGLDPMVPAIENAESVLRKSEKN